MSHCSQCGIEFSCGMVDSVSTQQCWCTALPTASKGELMLDETGQAKTCMCELCLSALRASRAPQTPDSETSRSN